MSEQQTPRTFWDDFRRFFGRGLAILLPSIVTLWLLFYAALFVYNNVAQPINTGIRSVVLWGVPRVAAEEQLPEWFVVDPAQVTARLTTMADRGEIPPGEVSDEGRRSVVRADIRQENLSRVWARHWYLDGLGLLVAIVAIYFTGLLLGNYIGRELYGRLERQIARIPGFKQVYPHVKQVVDLIFGKGGSKAFSEVVLIEYPREGIYTIAFLTGPGFQELKDKSADDVVTVFVPTSPTPMTGFTVNVRRSELKHLEMPVEQALRFIITAGVLTPDSAMPEEVPKPTLRELLTKRRPADAGEPGSGAGPDGAGGAAVSGEDR